MNKVLSNVEHEQLRKELQTEITKRVTGWSLALIGAIVTLAALGAWGLLKPILSSQLEIVPRSEISEFIEGTRANKSGIDLSGAIVLFTRGSSCPSGSNQVSDLHLLLRKDSGLYDETAALALDESGHDGGSEWNGHRFYGCHFE